MIDFYGRTEEMSIFIRVIEYALFRIRMQSHGKWGMCFQRDGKKSSGNVTGNQANKTTYFHALDGNGMN